VPFDGDLRVGGRFGVQGIPQTVIIDRDGIVRFVHSGYRPGDEAKLRAEIDSLLKEGGP
jgi:peroxiredoxin